MNQIKEIRGKKVIIRPLTRRALEEVAAWPRHTGIYACYNREEFETRESRNRWYTRNAEDDPSVRWFSIHKIDSGLIGLINIHKLKNDPWHREAEIGIEMQPDECNKGYGTDAITAFARNIFEKTGLTHLGLGTRTWNKRALKCYKKCGFVRCGRSTMMLNGKNLRFIEMELTKKCFSGG